ncbi:MAG: HlyD family secretion protein [Reyranella sp.]|jgi:multidrug resistance efflux pump|uniref:efflux RND transporter periplasmic adaptor subunit n=1 Tax=Reyranella sp. TaxID=1929291 RepID=UPI00095BDCF9|nr:HlyD family secretion protein [Reyranella sp.]MBN9536254.1 HlyD family secretion protein [Alphaproteobacteria bacterium]MBR2816226.1 HlyD family secretion protein [Reyranella sp.]OJU41341.1 MAG: efflux transporter periplasmic adaptor subunit [Alphaproteobacteria bacterium 65-37]
MKLPTLALRVLITLVVAAGAVLAGTMLWQYYVDSPWTRDARVAAEIVVMAPDVSGIITDLRVVNNQRVSKGDVLFVIDKERFALAVQRAQAALDSQRVQTRQLEADAERRARLGETAVSVQAKEQAESAAKAARAAVDLDEAALAAAKLDLERTTVRSPVDGYVSTLTLRQGAYATAGKAVMAIVDAGSFHVRGYFEETKIPRIHPGDRVEIRLMSFPAPLHGHVESIDRAIADRELAINPANLVVDVNPTFSWIRLAQRIPVRIAIDKVPDGVLLASGMTATVVVQPERK